MPRWENEKLKKFEEGGKKILEALLHCWKSAEDILGAIYKWQRPRSKLSENLMLIPLLLIPLLLRDSVMRVVAFVRQDLLNLDKPGK